MAGSRLSELARELVSSNDASVYQTQHFPQGEHRLRLDLLIARLVFDRAPGCYAHIQHLKLQALLQGQDECHPKFLSRDPWVCKINEIEVESFFHHHQLSLQGLRLVLQSPSDSKSRCRDDMEIHYRDCEQFQAL